MQLFEAEIYQGHSDRAVVVPFAPPLVWGLEPRRIGYRKYEGWAVRGSIAGEPFEGWIWHYFKRFVMVIDDAVLERAGVGPGESVSVAVEPHPDPSAVLPYQPGKSPPPALR